MVLKRIAVRDGGLVFCSFRLCTRAEWRCRDCGASDGGSDDPDGNVRSFPGWRKPGVREGFAHFEEAGLCLRDDEDFDEIAGGDSGDEHEDDGLDLAHAVSLKGQEKEHVSGGL